MATGKSGSFELTGTKGFTLRVAWSETYETATNTSVVSITSVQVKSTANYLYRAEYWYKSESGTSPRGPMVGTYRIVVTEEFWNGISDRGFNISTISKDTLTTDDRDSVASAFKIYIPVN
jgi:hypothetical protein